MNIYSEQVRKVYPDAEVYMQYLGVFEIVETFDTINPLNKLGSSAINEIMAWKDAYERIQKEQDLTTDNCSEI